MNLILGDCLEEMAKLEESSVDAVVTDPPYGLGFMGKAWDSLPPGPETAAAMLRVLKPAHYLLAFGGTRTHHRLMVALEDAGFEIRDCLMWLYGSGFPKGKGNLKPAYEPIILARKPGAKVRELGIDECRIGTSSTPRKDPRNGNLVNAHMEMRPWMKRRIENGEPLKGDFDGSAGRWPANILLDEEAAALLDEMTGALAAGAFPGEADTNSRADGWGYAGGREGPRVALDAGGASRFFYTAKASASEREEGCERLEAKHFGQSGGAQQALAAGATEYLDPGTIGLNRIKVRRNNHPTVKPVDLMRWLVRLVCPAGGTVLDPFMGSGTTGVACAEEQRDFIGIEREPDYCRIAESRIAAATAQQRFEVLA